MAFWVGVIVGVAVTLAALIALATCATIAVGVAWLRAYIRGI